MARGANAFVTKADTANTILTAIQQTLDKNNNQGKTHTTSLSGTPGSTRLTARQYEVLDLLNKGLSNKVIARELACTENTVRGHVQAILLFFQVASRSEAVYAAKQQGILH
jgi:DNA-binding NarL/FixJ family response regulator